MIWLFQSLFLIYVFYMVGDAEGTKPPRHFFAERTYLGRQDRFYRKDIIDRFNILDIID